MAEEKKIPLVLTVEGVKAIKTVGELKKGIADTRKELEKTEVGSKRFDELSEAIKAADNRLADLNKKATAFKDFPGPIGALAKTFDDVKLATGRVIASMTTLKGLLITSGIGALVVAFGSLMAYFRGTEEGAQRLRVVMAVFGAVMDQIKEVAINLGRAIFDAFENPKQAIEDFAGLVKKWVINQITLLIEGLGLLGSAISKVFKGDFEGAAEDGAKALKKLVIERNAIYQAVKAAAGAVKELAENAIEAGKAAGVLEAALNRVKVRERELKEERAEANKVIAEQRFIAQDTTLAIEDRIKALEKAEEVEQRLAQSELANERERLRIMEAKSALASDDEAAIEALTEQRVRVAQIEEQSLMRQRTVARMLNTLRKEEATEAKRIADEREKEEKERAEREIEFMREVRDTRNRLIAEDEERELAEARAKFEDKLARIAEEFGEETELYKLLEEERGVVLQEIRDKFEAKRQAEEEKARAAQLKAEQELAAARVTVAQSVASGLASVSQMIQGESEAAVVARKILAGAQIAIDTATAIAGAISAGSSMPYPANLAAIATGVATVLANVAQATQLLNSAPVGGGGSVAPPSASAVMPPQIAPVTTNTMQVNDTQQIELAPVQAYVVETDITGNQQNINQIQSQANFG